MRDHPDSIYPGEGLWTGELAIVHPEPSDGRYELEQCGQQVVLRVGVAGVLAEAFGVGEAVAGA